MVAGEPVIPLKRWKKLRGRLGTRKVVGGQVIIVPPARTVRRPKLRALDKRSSAIINRELQDQLAQSY
jgi:hypothetical protein